MMLLDRLVTTQLLKVILGRIARQRLAKHVPERYAVKRIDVRCWTTILVTTILQAYPAQRRHEQP
jgi:hypothetical protein